MTRRCFPAWLATLALLTHLLAMSVAGLPADVQRVDGNPNPTHHAEEHTAHADAAPARHAGHEGVGHGGALQCCCAGFSGLAALPFDPPRLPDRLVRRVGLLPERPFAVPLPRDQWPALNPRASPLA
ncbi:DUF2946 family protein [Stutzerimonas stutzeri]|uniref:DUF2946 family protein n=1 Tax=Stutzerimonas stutzeri TaxID=316 RepID=UPI0002FBCBB4|nr:DUF2946 family protein [Stutzerimonas stutzeri]